MNNAKHTKGPWTLSDVNSDDLKKFARFAPVVVYAMDDCGIHPIADCSCNHTCREDSQQIANAQLIAAAPDMAEALKFYADPETYNRRFDVGIGTTTDLMKDNEGDIARAALAKAGVE